MAGEETSNVLRLLGRHQAHTQPCHSLLWDNSLDPRSTITAYDTIHNQSRSDGHTFKQRVSWLTPTKRNIEIHHNLFISRRSAAQFLAFSCSYFTHALI